ncbi:hypothetical protein Pelo_19175 [Pelomyxa schiedti]|nr:hypothetical protein Pelo_19175 [Pelomyxa schiedti]
MMADSLGRVFHAAKLMPSGPGADLDLHERIAASTSSGVNIGIGPSFFLYLLRRVFRASPSDDIGLTLKSKCSHPPCTLGYFPAAEHIAHILTG